MSFLHVKIADPLDQVRGFIYEFKRHPAIVSYYPACHPRPSIVMSHVFTTSILGTTCPHSYLTFTHSSFPVNLLRHRRIKIS